MSDREFKPEDFTDEELRLLRTIFNMADAMIQGLRDDNYDTYLSNQLYYLEEKLGILNLID